MKHLPFPFHAVVKADACLLPSIFEEGDNVYDTYANPAEDPRKAHRYLVTGAATPSARIKRAA